MSSQLSDGLSSWRTSGIYCWVRSVRTTKTMTFLMVYDGSTSEDVQIAYRGKLSPKPALHQSLCVDMEWRPVWTRWMSIPRLELVATSARFRGGPFEEDGAKAYPVAKKKTPMSHLRQHPDERIRTRTVQRIQRLSSRIALGTHLFFQDRDFQWVRTPVLTGEDCEGAGEQFAIAGAADFFGTDMSLSVSGQLDLEKQVVGGIGRGYAFGPTFRAEKSHTRRHLAEFWMVEPELVLDSLGQLMDLAEDYVRSCVEFSDLDADHALGPFARVSYTDAVDMLQAEWADLSWGDDLCSAQETRLCEMHGGRPVFVHHYPRALKSFYMRDTRDRAEDEGRETVECMDLLVPGVGELIGGSMREEDGARLRQKMLAKGMDVSRYASYMKTRGRVSVPHGGFGLGFERLVQYVSQAEHICDTIPYPRVAK
jgi:asparaginyl-tRNA synthetase